MDSSAPISQKRARHSPAGALNPRGAGCCWRGTHRSYSGASGARTDQSVRHQGRISNVSNTRRRAATLGLRRVQRGTTWRKTKKPTMADVAARAGVSLSTVSLTYSGAGPISPDTKARVERAAEELGYGGPVPARARAAVREVRHRRRRHPREVCALVPRPPQPADPRQPHRRLRRHGRRRVC